MRAHPPAPLGAPSADLVLAVTAGGHCAGRAVHSSVDVLAGGTSSCWTHCQLPTGQGKVARTLWQRVNHACVQKTLEIQSKGGRYPRALGLGDWRHVVV